MTSDPQDKRAPFVVEWRDGFKIGIAEVDQEHRHLFTLVRALNLGTVDATVEELLKSSDVVSVHVPLLPTTRHLIDAKKLKMMKKTAILVNTSRGPVVDEKALVSALKSKRIAAAGLDVYEFEPKLAPGLAKLPNLTLTPHTASATIETRDAMSKIAAQGIIDALSGKTPGNLIPLP